MLLILVKVSVNMSENEQTQCRSYGLLSNIWTEGTDTCTRIGSMVIALCLQSVAVVDRQATFTDTSTRISRMVIALWPQSVAVIDRQHTYSSGSNGKNGLLVHDSQTAATEPAPCYLSWWKYP